MTGAITVPEHVLVRRVDTELVLLNLDNEEYYGLDAVGTAMWEALTSASDMRSAVTDLLERFDVDEDTLVRDLDALVQELSARGLVIEASP